MPKKLRTWLAAINTAAPAVKPMTTVCEMKFTSAPMRAKPKINSKTPTRNVTVSTSRMYSAEPGSARWERAAKTAMEMAVVGPETRCQLEPKKAPITAGIMAA